MRRTLPFCSIICFSFLLGGCSLPASVSAVSWAIDGASYVTTKKSLTDHGLSLIAGQDCALHRFIARMDPSSVCQNHPDLGFSAIRIADASELIESQISKYNVDEIFYSFDMAQPSSKDLVFGGSEITQEIALNKKYYVNQAFE